MTPPQQHPRITLEPPLGTAAFAPTPTQPDPRLTRTREQLGLPTDRPVILAGHQARLWHPGILAKRLAIQTIASRHNAHAHWLVVDQDDNDPGEISYPHKTDQAWQRTTDSLNPTKHKAGTPTASRPAFEPKPGTRQPSFDPAITAIRNHASAPSAAHQLTLATNELLGDHIPFFTATDLARTDLFAALIEDAMLDPDRCRATLNTAIEAHPDAGMRPLRPGQLPYWKTTDAGPRAAATQDDLAGIPPDQLLPRGILMTLLARLAACDLFVHGTGGRAYEPVADRWLELWNPPSLRGLTPAPYAIATADLTLSLIGTDIPTQHDVAAAKYKAHHARHHPALLGDEARQTTRNELLRQLNEAPPWSRERAAYYRQLQDLLEHTRTDLADKLDQLRQHAADTQAAFDARAILAARDWPFVLYEHDQLDELKHMITTSL